MKRIPLSKPEIAMIGGTRAAFGAGVGLLVADRLNNDQRRAVGWTLLAVGLITTIPIVLQVFGSSHNDDEVEHRPHRGDHRSASGRFTKRERVS
jgi:hypothetical protein